MIRLIAIIILAIFLLVLAVPVMAASTIQMPASGWDYLGGGDSPSVWSRLGQRLTINDGEIYAVGYRLSRVGSPTGDVRLSVRDSITDDVLWSQVWGDASGLPISDNNTYIKLDIIPTLEVDGDVRVCVEYWGGNATDYVQAGYYTGDKITGQWYTNYANYATDASGWHDIGESEEAAYYMSYVSEDIEPVGGDGDSGFDFNKFWMGVGAGGIIATLLIGTAILRKTKMGVE